MNEHQCSECGYYLQHYIRFPNHSLMEVYCGHCWHPQVKHHVPDTPACKNFKKKEEPEKKPTEINQEEYLKLKKKVYRDMIRMMEEEIKD